MSAVDEMLRMDGLIPVTAQTISELVQEVFRLREALKISQLPHPYYVREGAHGEWCVDRRRYDVQGDFISRAATKKDAEIFARELNAKLST